LWEVAWTPEIKYIIAGATGYLKEKSGFGARKEDNFKKVKFAVREHKTSTSIECVRKEVRSNIDVRMEEFDQLTSKKTNMRCLYHTSRLKSRSKKVVGFCLWIEGWVVPEVFSGNCFLDLYRLLYVFTVPRLGLVSSSGQYSLL
jgi:hypothetical protein